VNSTNISIWKLTASAANDVNQAQQTKQFRDIEAACLNCSLCATIYMG